MKTFFFFSILKILFLFHFLFGGESDGLVLSSFAEHKNIYNHFYARIMDIRFSEMRGDLINLEDLEFDNLALVQKKEKILYKSYITLAKEIKKNTFLNIVDKLYLETLALYYGALVFSRSSKTVGYVEMYEKSDKTEVLDFLEFVQKSSKKSKSTEEKNVYLKMDVVNFCKKMKKPFKKWRKLVEKTNKQGLLRGKDQWLYGSMLSDNATCVAGKSFSQMKIQLTKAKEAQRQALMINKKHSLANIEMAILYYRDDAIDKNGIYSMIKNLEKAEQYLKTAIRYGDEYERFLAHIWLSQVYLKKKEPNIKIISAELEKAKKICAKGPLYDYAMKFFDKGIYF